MNKLTLTIELCAEDRARLDNILEALRGQAGTPCKEAAEAVTPLKPIQQEEKAPEQPAEDKPEPTPAPAEQPALEPGKAEEAPAAPEVSAAEVQSKVVQLVSAGKKEEVKAIVMEYAKCVGEIPAEKRAEVMGRLSALEG